MCVAVIVPLEKTGRLSVPEEHMGDKRDRKRHLKNAGHGYRTVEAPRLHDGT